MPVTGSPPRLTWGTKEPLPIQLKDTLETLTTLSGHDLRYDLFKDDDEETPVIVNASCPNDGMLALPLIDTTVLGFEEGYYNIFLTFTNGSEAVRLGPYRFLVDD